MNFNVIDQAWVPVVRMDGTTIEVGLRDALAHAHEYRLIRDPLPTVEFGLYRLLVTLMLDIFEPGRLGALGSLLRKGQFETAKIEAYFDTWKERFDLFDSTYPFLQTAGMEKDTPKALAGLLHPMPSGTNAAHFHHTHEDEFGICPAAAARLLTTIAPFMTAGGAGLSPSINGAPPWYALIVGETLFQTICLNALVIDQQKQEGSAPPAWRDDRALTKDRATSASLLEAFTWRPRRLRLITGKPGVCSLTDQPSDVLIRTMKFAAGSGAGFPWRDPSVPYRIDGKIKPPEDPRKVMRPREGKALWRDTAPIALLNERDYSSGDNEIRFERPRLIDQFEQLRDNGLPRYPCLNLMLYGMRTDMKMKIFEWYRETLSLPQDLVLQSPFHLRIHEEMGHADSVEYALKRALKMTYPRDGAGNKNAFDSRIAHAQQEFWTELHPAFDEFLSGIAELSLSQEAEYKAVHDQWQAAVKSVGKAVLDDAVGELDTDAEALKRQAWAVQFFHNQLTYIFATLEEKAARRESKKKTISSSKISEGDQE